MKKIALVFCHAIALVFGQGIEERSSIYIDKHASTRQLKQHDIRLRGRIFRESENQQDRTLVRELSSVLRYVPIKLGLSLETSESGDINTDELNSIVGDHLLTYLQEQLTEYEAVSVETIMATLSEPLRRLEINETLPMILQVRASGFVYFAGDGIPTSEYLDEFAKSAFEGDENDQFLNTLKSAKDSVLQSTTAVWPSVASKEEYLAIESSSDMNDSSSSIWDTIMDNIVYISTGLACGVALIALYVGVRYYRQSKRDERDDLSLTEIPWLSVQVPKRAPKRGAGSDIQSTMEAPIEAMAGETTSVMIAVGGDKPEKIDMRSISSIPKLALPPEDKTVMLTNLYEKSLLCDGGLFECKTLSFDDGDIDDVISSNIDEEIAARKALPPPVTTQRPITPETVNDRGQEIKVDSKGDDIMISEEDNSLEERSIEEKPKKTSFSSKMKKKMSIRKKVSLPSLKKSKSKKAKKNAALDAIKECDEEAASYSIAHLANVDSRETEEPPSAGIFAAISKTESGIMDAWDHISKSMTSVSSKDFENTSFDCLGPSIVSTMSESQAVDNESDDNSEAYTQNTESEYMSQFTNPSYVTDSYSYDSESTYSDDGYSR